MYLVSLYLDEDSSRKIERFINRTALKSGNFFMTDGKVPPHITIASFQSKLEDEVIANLDKTIKNLKAGTITWGSIGVFKSSVIFLAPVLNEYLHSLSVNIYESISRVENILISRYYIPFQWMPHTTIAKKLNREELMISFAELEKEFSIFSGKVVKIALSKTNPYEDIKVWEL